MSKKGKSKNKAAEDVSLEAEEEHQEASGKCDFLNECHDAFNTDDLYKALNLDKSTATQTESKINLLTDLF